LKKNYLNVKEVDSYTDSLNQTTSYVKRSTFLGSTITTLMVGNNANVQASSLIKFSTTLTDTLISDIDNNNVIITYARVNLISNYRFGDSLAIFNFGVNKVLNSWSGDSIDGDNLSSLSVVPVDLSSNKIDLDTLISFDLDKSYVMSLLKSIADSTQPADYGIYLKPALYSKKVVGYQSLSGSSSTFDTLKVVVQKPGDYSDTLYLYPSLDACIVTGSLPKIPSEDIVVQRGLVINSKLWFDFSSLPKNISINYANLTLTIDTLATIVGTNYVNSVDIRFLTDSTLLTLDSTQTTVTLTRSGNTFQGNIAAFVQNWINKGNNVGLLIEATSQTEGLELFALKGSNAADRSVRPRLQITYTGKN
jgi:hypothetical protein